MGEVGELVLTRPMPSMPVGFWGDEDGSRYRAAYFEDIPGVWRHGDWTTITERGSLVITGRSDATLNRGGVRLGTSEFYRVVEDLPGVRDSLVVHLEDDEGGAGELVLFVAVGEAAGSRRARPRAGTPSLTDCASAWRASCVRGSRRGTCPTPSTPWRALPHTLSGKKLEVPVKRVLRGADPDAAVSKEALDDPAAYDALARLAAARSSM